MTANCSLLIGRYFRSLCFSALSFSCLWILPWGNIIFLSSLDAWIVPCVNNFFLWFKFDVVCKKRIVDWKADSTSPQRPQTQRFQVVVSKSCIWLACQVGVLEAGCYWKHRPVFSFETEPKLGSVLLISQTLSVFYSCFIVRSLIGRLRYITRKTRRLLIALRQTGQIWLSWQISKVYLASQVSLIGFSLCCTGAWQQAFHDKKAINCRKRFQPKAFYFSVMQRRCYFWSLFADKTLVSSTTLLAACESCHITWFNISVLCQSNWKSDLIWAFLSRKLNVSLSNYLKRERLNHRFSGTSRESNTNPFSSNVFALCPFSMANAVIDWIPVLVANL